MGSALLRGLPFVLLALAGWWLAHIPGLLMGVALAVWLEHSGLTGKFLAGLQQAGAGQTPFSAEHCWFMLLGYLAKLNGRVMPAHIQAARLEMRRQGLDGYRYQAAIAAFNQGKTQELAALKSSLRAHFSTSQDAERLLSSAWRLVWAEGSASRVQYQVLRQCGQWLGVSTERLLQLEQQARPGKAGQAAQGMKVRLSERDAALRLLGLQPPVSDFARIKLAYRRLLSEHHPDRLTGAGASAREIEQANVKTRELHAAYELLRQYYRQR